MANMTPIPSGTDPAQVTAMLNNNFRALNNEQVTKLYNDATGTPSILIGLDSTGKSIIKIAQTGVDVTTATDSQLAFDSSRKTFQIIGTPFSTPFTVTSGAGFTGTTVSINHSLGYIPLTESVATITTNGWSVGEVGNFPLPYQSMATSGTIRGYAAYVILKQVTTTTITYEIGITGGTLTLAGTITCYIKQAT
jgi:hypothetical protein